MFVGLTGAPFSGKKTLAKYLETELNFEIIDFFKFELEDNKIVDPEDSGPEEIKQD